MATTYYRDPVTRVLVPTGGGGSQFGVVVASPGNFPGIDPTGATSSFAGMTDFVAAIPDGGTGIIPPGTYLLDKRLAITGKSTHIRAHGANFVGTSTSGIINMIGGLGVTYTVASLVTEKVAGLGHTDEEMWVTRLNLVTEPPALIAGNVVKVVADDTWDDAAPSVGGNPLRVGQCCVVVGVSGNQVTVAGQMRSPYTTGIRMAKFVDHQMSWEGGTFSHGQSLIDNPAVAPYIMSMDLLLHPRVEDVRVTRSVGTCFYTQKTYGARIIDCTVDQVADADAHYGYGVSDGGEYTVVSKFFGKRLRHGYTTAARRTTAGDPDLINYGQAYGATVADGICHGTTQTAWDTHGDGLSITFENCSAFDCYNAFNVRGVGHRIIGGHVVRCGNGVTVGTASSATNVYGVVVDGLVIDSTDGLPIYVWSDTGFQGKPVYVDNILVKEKPAGGTVLRVVAATVWMGRITVVAGDAEAIIQLQDDAVVLPLPSMALPVPPVAEKYKPVMSNSPAGQPDGTVLTLANSGGLSGDAFTYLFGAPTFSAEAFVSGGLSYKVVGVDGTGTEQSFGWGSDLEARNPTARFYARFAALPTVRDMVVAQFRNTNSVGATKSCGNLWVNRDGSISVSASLSTLLTTSAPAVIAPNTWYRVEMRVSPGTVEFPDRGVISVAVYPVNSLVPVFTYFSEALSLDSGDVHTVRFGKPHQFGTATVYIDEVTVTTT